MTPEFAYASTAAVVAVVAVVAVAVWRMDLLGKRQGWARRVRVGADEVRAGYHGLLNEYVGPPAADREPQPVARAAPELDDNRAIALDGSLR